MLSTKQKQLIFITKIVESLTNSYLYLKAIWDIYQLKNSKYALQ